MEWAGPMSRSRVLLPLASIVAISAMARPAHAVDPVPSFRYLVTGNGRGFQVFDVSANAVKQFLERPYRYIQANSSNPDGEGVVRRNLAFDTYFGLRVGGTAAWFGGRAPDSVGYVDQSNVIRSTSTLGGLTANSYFVSPFGYEGNAMVMLLEVHNGTGSAQSATAFSIHNFKMGSASNPDAPDSNGESIAWDGSSMTATENGPGGGVIVYAPLGGMDVSSCNSNAYTAVQGGGNLTSQAACSGSDQKNAFQKDLGSIPPGESRWWGVAILFDADGNANNARTAWTNFLGGKTPEQLYTSVLAEFEAWRKMPAPGLSTAETAIWRQAETVLRMGQITEPYTDTPRRHNTGMILASLPPGGWHTGWVRDATYAINALARTGHATEAKSALDFFLNADAGRYQSFVANQPYRISTVRYYGDGQEEADYSGSPTRNIEIDGWGLFLWAARTYVDSTGDVSWLNQPTKKGDTVYDAIKSGVADPLVANLESSGLAIADASIWEVHWGNRQHFLYTTATAARGFCDMATLARRAGKTADIAKYQMLAEKVTTAMKTNLVDSNKVLAGSLERLASGANYRDGATVESITWSLIPANDTIATSTLGAMSYLQTPAGGYKRVEGSNDQYDTDEWILIDLRASAAFRRAGNGPKADQLLNWVTSQATANYDLLPELYNTRTSSGTIGAYSGSIPMVGYGAGAYELTMLDRVQLYEHSDCGEKDLNEYPDMGPVLPGDGGMGNGNNDLGGRTGIACACSSGSPSGSTLIVFLVVGFLVFRRRRINE